VSADEGKASCEAGDGVAETFGRGATNEEVLFVLRDEVDVLFDVTLGHAAFLRCKKAGHMCFVRRFAFTKARFVGF
jgi:hypothetical protein